MKLIDPFLPAVGAPPRTLLAFLKWALSGGFKLIWIGMIASATLGVLEVLTALFLGWVIDAALGTGTEAFFSQHLWLLGAAVLFFVGARPLAMGINSMLGSVYIGPNINPLVLSRLHRWTLGQDVTFFDNDFAGRIAQKQMQTSRAVTDIVVETVNVIAFAIASMIGSALLLTAIDYRVAITLAVWLVFYILVIRLFIPKVRIRATNRAATRAMVTGQIVDTITNIKTVKLFAHADHEDNAALDAMETSRLAGVHFGWMAAGMRFSLMTLAGFLPVLLVGGALYLWSIGIASAGDIAATGAISIRIAQMTGWVSHMLMMIYSAIGEVEDGMKTLTPPHGLVDVDGAKPLVVDRGEIEFAAVNFAYGGEKGGIKDVNLVIKSGEKLGIVGASGAGKSTLVSLLLRLYDTEEGAVKIDGQNIGQVSQESLRRAISMVTQDSAMFNRTARENILYGRPDASEADVELAAQRAEASSFIPDLTDFRGRRGYDAFLGERGVKLSGGQRQRIALARALLKDAPILVLDEATSALDSEVEAAIQSALEQAMEGKTVLAIAHRLSTLSQMDRIIVLDDGRIVEEGNHTTLLAQKGLYARYWDRQSGGFINADEAE